MKISMKAKFRKRVFRYICSTLFASGMILSTFLPNTAKAADVHSYPTVAVMQFGNKAITSQGLRRYDFDSASEYAIYQLLASGWFDLVDYEQLSNIAKMHEINMSGLVDQSTAVQLGKFAGAQFMVVGNVTGLTSKESGLDYQHGRSGGLGVDVRTVIANVAIRIVDIETGRIVGAGLGKGESASSNVEIVFKKYRKSSNGILPMSDNGLSNNNEEEDDGNNDDNSNEGVSDYSKEEVENYSIKIGSDTFSAVQVRNAISKAVRDAVYGNTGLMTMLNDGKRLKIKTGF